MKIGALPLKLIYDLGGLSQAGVEVVIRPDEAECAALAHWIGADVVEAFQATTELRRSSQTRFVLEASFSADIVQSCVVTLDPVRSHIEREFSRRLFLSPTAYRKPRKDSENWPIVATEDDAPEEIEGLRYDLAGPLLEELVLAIDPYPRAPGVSFESAKAATDAAEPAQSPFAALKSLKNQP